METQHLVTDAATVALKKMGGLAVEELQQYRTPVQRSEEMVNDTTAWPLTEMTATQFQKMDEATLA